MPSALATVQGRSIAAVEGEIALAAGDGRAALEQFRTADVGSCQACSGMRFARAFDQFSQPDSVIFWYEPALASNVGRLVDRVEEIPRAYRRLGELYEATGDTKRAIQRYSDFVELVEERRPGAATAREGCARAYRAAAEEDGLTRVAPNESAPLVEHRLQSISYIVS